MSIRPSDDVRCRPTGGSHELFVTFAATRDVALRDELVTANLGLGAHPRP